MPRDHVSVRIGGDGLTRIDNIAAVLSGDDDGQRSPVIRRLVGEALGQRERECKASHRGPIASQRCGHCGQGLE